MKIPKRQLKAYINEAVYNVVNNILYEGQSTKDTSDFDDYIAKNRPNPFVDKENVQKIMKEYGLNKEQVTELAQSWLQKAASLKKEERNYYLQCVEDGYRLALNRVVDRMFKSNQQKLEDFIKTQAEEIKKSAENKGEEIKNRDKEIKNRKEYKESRLKAEQLSEYLNKKGFSSRVVVNNDGDAEIIVENSEDEFADFIRINYKKMLEKGFYPFADHFRCNEVKISIDKKKAPQYLEFLLKKATPDTNIKQNAHYTSSPSNLTYPELGHRTMPADNGYRRAPYSQRA